MLSIQDGTSVAVVGAGVIGLSAAYRLAESGIENVTLIDPSRGLRRRRDCDPARGVRQQWGSRVNCPLAGESYVFYRELEEQLGVPVEAAIQPGGYLFVAEALEELNRNRLIQNGAGVPSAADAGAGGRARPGVARRHARRRNVLPRGRLLRQAAGGRRGRRRRRHAATARASRHRRPDTKGGPSPFYSNPIRERLLRAAIRALLPTLEFVAFSVHVAGDYDLTPDRQMIVGPVDGAPGLVLAAGMSGRGFMMAPAVGRLVAETITESRHDPLLELVSLSRYDQATLALEPQVV